MHNRGSQKLPGLCVQTFPPESCILTQHLRPGLLNTSPGASLHTQMCSLCPQPAELHLQRISQQHRARALSKHPQQSRAGKELDSRGVPALQSSRRALQQPKAAFPVLCVPPWAGWLGSTSGKGELRGTGAGRGSTAEALCSAGLGGRLWQCTGSEGGSPAHPVV